MATVWEMSTSPTPSGHGTFTFFYLCSIVFVCYTEALTGNYADDFDDYASDDDDDDDDEIKEDEVLDESDSSSTFSVEEDIFVSWAFFFRSL